MKRWRVCGMVLGDKRNNTQISCVFHHHIIETGCNVVLFSPDESALGCGPGARRSSMIVDHFSTRSFAHFLVNPGCDVKQLFAEPNQRPTPVEEGCASG